MKKALISRTVNYRWHFFLHIFRSFAYNLHRNDFFNKLFKCGINNILVISFALLVEQFLEAGGRPIGGVKPSITPIGEGLHDVSYVPPPYHEPYKVNT